MPLPTPLKGEKYRKFLSRFLRNKVVKKEFPDIKQRFAIAVSTWSSKNKK